MNLYPKDPKHGQKLKSDAGRVSVDESFIAHFQVAAAAATVASTTGVHAAAATSTEATVIDDDFTQPSVPRNITLTAGGTAGDIKAVSAVVAGTDYADEAITETMPAFTLNTAGTVTGSKAFKTITSVTIPAMDGAGATVAVGFGEKLGLPFKLAHDTVLATYKDNTAEGTAPTVTTSTSVLASNTIDLNSALNSKALDVYLLV